MANLLIPWQRYLSDVAHKYVGYPDDEEGGENTMIINVNTETGAFDKTYNEIFEAAKTQSIVAIASVENQVSQYPLLGITSKGEYMCFLLSLDVVNEVYQPIIVTAAADTADDYPVLVD